MELFWKIIDRQVDRLKTATSAADVLRILATEDNPYGPDVTGAPAFFAGGGGDKSVLASLQAAGWSIIWAEAPYHWSATAPDGTSVTYVEGDIYEGDSRAAA